MRPRDVRDGRIELLNTRWHEPGHPSVRVGSCAACEADVVADERVRYHEGELYHLRCAIHRRGV